MNTLARLGGGSVAFTARVSSVNGQTIVTLGNFMGNNDGRIDIADFGQFAVRYFTILP